MAQILVSTNGGQQYSAPTGAQVRGHFRPPTFKSLCLILMRLIADPLLHTTSNPNNYSSSSYQGLRGCISWRLAMWLGRAFEPPRSGWRKLDSMRKENPVPGKQYFKSKSRFFFWILTEISEFGSSEWEGFLCCLRSNSQFIKNFSIGNKHLSLRTVMKSRHVLNFFRQCRIEWLNLSRPENPYQLFSIVLCNSVTCAQRVERYLPAWILIFSLWIAQSFMLRAGKQWRSIHSVCKR